MLSGQKRTGREYDVSMPSIKRSKVDSNDKPHASWPHKQKLTRKQTNELPSMMNPSFHKAVFETFWNKKKFGAPVISTNEVESNNNKQKLFQCQMTLNNKQNKSQQLVITSDRFDSKKKAQINVYQQFNLNYIPFKSLIERMEPYSFSTKVNLQQIVTQKGEFLKSKTETIVVEPVPLSFNEVDIMNLTGNTSSDDMIQYIEFERDSDKSIYKKVYIEFNDTRIANKFAQSLNGKTYQKHKLCATWTANRSNAQTFKQKSAYLKGVGFPLDISRNRVLQFLYEHKIEPLNICLICKYSLISQVFLKFETISDCADALQTIKNLKYKDIKNKQYALYWRHSREFEYNQATVYQTDIKKIHDEVIRASNCIDVMNVSWDTKEEQLKRLFSKCGAIEKMHINHRKDLFPGTAFIKFEGEDCSKKAILTLNGYKLNGYNLKVSIHLKQTREDKKRIKQWYVEQEEEKIRNDKERKANKAKKKKERAKRKRLRRAARALRR